MKNFFKIFVLGSISIVIILLILLLFKRSNENISLEEFVKHRDSLIVKEKDDNCKQLLYEANEELKRGNIILYLNEYIPHFDELLFNKYNIILEHMSQNIIHCCKPFMDSIIYCKYGKENIEKLKLESIEINKKLESYICLDGAYKSSQSDAQFVGGIESLIKYTNKSTSKEYDKKVEIIITIDTCGKVTEAKVYKKFSPELDKRSLDLALKMPNWIPAKDGGKKVRFRRIVEFYW